MSFKFPLPLLVCLTFGEDVCYDIKMHIGEKLNPQLCEHALLERAQLSGGHGPS